MTDIRDTRFVTDSERHGGAARVVVGATGDMTSVDLRSLNTSRRGAVVAWETADDPATTLLPILQNGVQTAYLKIVPPDAVAELLLGAGTVPPNNVHVVVGVRVDDATADTLYGAAIHDGASPGAFVETPEIYNTPARRREIDVDGVTWRLYWSDARRIASWRLRVEVDRRVVQVGTALAGRGDGRAPLDLSDAEKALINRLHDVARRSLLAGRVTVGERTPDPVLAPSDHQQGYSRFRAGSTDGNPNINFGAFRATGAAADATDNPTLVSDGTTWRLLQVFQQTVDNRIILRFGAQDAATADVAALPTFVDFKIGDKIFRQRDAQHEISPRTPGANPSQTRDEAFISYQFDAADADLPATGDFEIEILGEPTVQVVMPDALGQILYAVDGGDGRIVWQPRTPEEAGLGSGGGQQGQQSPGSITRRAHVVTLWKRAASVSAAGVPAPGPSDYTDDGWAGDAAAAVATGWYKSVGAVPVDGDPLVQATAIMEWGGSAWAAAGWHVALSNLATRQYSTTAAGASPHLVPTAADTHYRERASSGGAWSPWLPLFSTGDTWVTIYSVSSYTSTGTPQNNPLLLPVRFSDIDFVRFRTALRGTYAGRERRTEIIVTPNWSLGGHNTYDFTQGASMRVGFNWDGWNVFAVSDRGFGAIAEASNTGMARRFKFTRSIADADEAVGIGLHEIAPLRQYGHFDIAVR